MIITGTITKTMPDGSAAKCTYMIDTSDGSLVQVGAEGRIVAEDIEFISALRAINPSELPEKPGQEAFAVTKPVTDVFTKEDTTITIVWGTNE